MRDKILSFTIGIILSAMALIPNIDFKVGMPHDNYWFWIITFSGFISFLMFYTNVPLTYKVLGIALFFISFFSAAPWIAFTNFFLMMLLLVLFWICFNIRDTRLLFNCVQAVLFLNLFLMAMQASGHDTLLNFGLSNHTQYGVVGQHQQEASFLVVVSAFLITSNVNNIYIPLIASIFCNSSWAMFNFSVGIFSVISCYYSTVAKGFFVMFFLIFLAMSVATNKIDANIDASGRFPNWAKSIELSLEKPFTGWGAGMYQYIYPVLGTQGHVPYKTAHNFIVQLLFEVGIPLTALILFRLVFLLASLWLDSRMHFAGLAMIVSNGLVHFPDRMIQCGALTVVYLAICERGIYHGFEQN